MVWTLLRITHLAHRKSYLVIISPNTHEKCHYLPHFTWKVKLGKVGVCSNITPIGSHIWPLLAPIHMRSWPNMKLGQIIGPNSHEKLTQYKIRSSYYLLQFAFLSTLIWPNIPFFSIFCLTYLYLPLFTYIQPYLPLFCHICPLKIALIWP